jgi:hypothetical protein
VKEGSEGRKEVKDERRLKAGSEVKEANEGRKEAKEGK